MSPPNCPQFIFEQGHRANRAAGAKHGSAATFAIENLDADEERELLKYLAYYRSTRSGS
jgi:hypothetical protein